MEPQVQYAKTSDGVDIAFASMGEGPPLVAMPLPGFSHVQRSWGIFSDLFSPLTRSFRLIWYDSRGTGLSDRDAIDFSMDAMMRDLEAVIERAGLQSFSVLAIQDAVRTAVTYAATFPDHVSHLVLVNGWTNWADVADSPVHEAHDALIDKDWTLFTRSMQAVLSGIGET